MSSLGNINNVTTVLRFFVFLCLFGHSPLLDKREATTGVSQGRPLEAIVSIP